MNRILSKRARLGLVLGETAKSLGISRHVLWGWTSNWMEVHLKFIPRVIEWLGYGPIPEPTSFGACLRTCRMAAGCLKSPSERLLGIRAGTIGKFESGRIPNPDHRGRIENSSVVVEIDPAGH